VIVSQSSRSSSGSNSTSSSSGSRSSYSSTGSRSSSSSSSNTSTSTSSNSNNTITMYVSSPRKIPLLFFLNGKEQSMIVLFFSTSDVICHGYLDGDEDGCFFTYTNMKPAYLFSSPHDTNFNGIWKRM
jgi:hypothetical protein